MIRTQSRWIALGAVLALLAGLYLFSSPRDRDHANPLSVRSAIEQGLNDADHYRFSSAQRWLEQARAMAPRDPAPYIALGKLYYRKQDYAQAIDSFIAAARYAPSDSEVLYYAGLMRLRYKSARSQGTRLFFERSYQLDPANYLALKEWAQLTAQSEGRASALELIASRLTREPRNAALLWIKGVVYASTGDLGEAIRYYRQSLALNGKAAAVKMSLGDALKASGEPEKAIAEYWLAGILDPKYTEGFYRAAVTLFEVNHFVQAESMVHYLIQIAPDFPGAYSLLSRIYHEGERYDLSVDALEREADHHPENLTDRVDLADAEISIGRFEPAIALLKQVTGTSIDSIREPEYVTDWVRAFVVLSKAYRGLKRYDAAESAAREASRLDGKSLYIRREMAYVKAGLDFGN
jgi:tetratricopeptide (TPR) repeat protein